MRICNTCVCFCFVIYYQSCVDTYMFFSERNNYLLFIKSIYLKPVVYANLNIMDVLLSGCLFLRNTSLPALDAGFLTVSRIAYAKVWQGAHAVWTPAYAHWHASGTRDVSFIVRVSAIAGALIRTGTLAV